jgi:hypothetical protein
MEYWALQADLGLGRFFADEYDAAVRYWSECTDAEDQAENKYADAWFFRGKAIAKTKDAKRQLDRIKKIRNEPAKN